jgi:hypothetical protein
MSYTIRRFDKSNTTPALIVNDKKVDTSTTTLSFYGLNSSDFGAGLNENYLHLMEHFCNRDISLAKVVQGQLWFDTTIKKMKIWNGNRWHILKEYTTNKFPKGFVTIVGNTVNGETVSTANTLYDEDGLGDFTYQWYLGSDKITGATSPTYTILLSDVGKDLAVSLSYTDGSHNYETVYSKFYPINSAANHLPTGTLTITGIAEIDEILTAEIDNIQDADGLVGGGGNFGWMLDGVDIPGSNSPTYTIKPGDAGGTIKAKYYFTDLNNNQEVVYSNQVVIPYAVTTTTAEPTTTTTDVPVPGATSTSTTTEAPTTSTTEVPTTSTTTTRPDTSELDGKITLCNALVPTLKDIWFQAEKDRVITEQILAAEHKLGDDADNLSRRIGLENSDTAAIGKVITNYNKWVTGINACIQNKKDLFTILQNTSSALSLTQAYQSKLEIYKMAIDNAITFYNTTLNDYNAIIGKDVSDNRTHTTLRCRLELRDLSYDAWGVVVKYKSAWDASFNDAVTANLEILVTLNTSAAVSTVTTLAQYKTSTLKDIYEKLKVISDAANAKYVSVDGVTSIDQGARLEWEDLKTITSNHTTSVKNQWTSSITDGATLTTTAQNLLT